MQPLKQDALDAIATLPDDADIDEVKYRLYMLDKVRKGREASEQGRAYQRGTQARDRKEDLTCNRNSNR